MRRPQFPYLAAIKQKRHTFQLRQLLPLLLVLLCIGCTATTPETEPFTAQMDLFAMDTFMTLKAYGPMADELLETAKIRIRAIEDAVSVTNAESDIGRLNRAQGRPITVCKDSVTILQKAIELGERTDGALDVTIYPLVSAWGFTTGTYQIPTHETLDMLLPLVDYRKLTLDGTNVTLPDGMQLDLGALAKGYTGDVVASILREGGVTSALINLGGNVHTIGAKEDGTPWKVAVADPFAPEQNLLTLAITDAVVITSGNYERYFIGADDVRYCHILDGKTGYPADLATENSIVSMTIVMDSTIDDAGITADGLSTALFVRGAEGAEELWQTYGDFAMIYVTADQTIHVTEGLSFTNARAYPVETVRK